MAAGAENGTPVASIRGTYSPMLVLTWPVYDTSSSVQ